MKASAIRAVIFDWAGTTVDHGSVAPALAFVETFRRMGIEITIEEARGPMGKSKREHILSIVSLPRVIALWLERFGKFPDNDDVQSLYNNFIPVQKQLLESHSDVIQGVPEAVSKLRNRGIKIGSSTGYSRELMEVVAPIAARGGYSPEVIICSDDVPAGRPAPWMNFHAAQKLNIYPMRSILVVDDTPIGIQAGRNAGAITVAVTRTGNSLGLSAREVELLSKTDLDQKILGIEDEFRRAGADYLVESAAEIPSLLE